MKVPLYYLVEIKKQKKEILSFIHYVFYKQVYLLWLRIHRHVLGVSELERACEYSFCYLFTLKYGTDTCFRPQDRKIRF